MGLLNKKDLTSSAEVIDKHLILSLPNALEPVVWRMALDKIGTASFEIKPVKSDNTYKLILKPKKGTAETIAPFNQKEEALQALICASDALQKPESVASNDTQNIKETNTTSSPKRAVRKGSSKWLYLFIGFLLIFGLYLYMVNLIPEKIENFGSANSLSTTSKNASQTGVPVSADDFLNGL